MAIGVVGFDATSFTSAILGGVNTGVTTFGLLGGCALMSSFFGVRERLIIYSIIAVIIVNGLAPSFTVDSLSHIGH